MVTRGSTGFNVYLARRPGIPSRQPPLSAAANPDRHRTWNTKAARQRGGFRGQATWIARRSSNVRAGGDLPAILAAIADDIEHAANAASAAVMAEYAAKVAYARKHFPRALLAGDIRAFKEARDAALAVIKQNAKAARAARREAAIIRHRKRFCVVGRSSPHQSQAPNGPKPK
jgi:hypothetical protein